MYHGSAARQLQHGGGEAFRGSIVHTTYVHVRLMKTAPSGPNWESPSPVSGLVDPYVPVCAVECRMAGWETNQERNVDPHWTLPRWRLPRVSTSGLAAEGARWRSARGGDEYAYTRGMRMRNTPTPSWIIPIPSPSRSRDSTASSRDCIGVVTEMAPALRTSGP